MGMNHVIEDWAGQYVWIVGASTGIGAATARLLLEKGAHAVSYTHLTLPTIYSV